MGAAKIALASVVVMLSTLPGAVQARDQIRIVGSSTVYPFSTVVAESFGKRSGFKTPIIEATGSGGGFKLFCAGLGPAHPDMTNSSRRIKRSEIENCARNGVTEIVEVKIGYDGIVLANSKSAPPLSLTRKQLFLALARDIPVNGIWVANPNKMWSDIDPSLPSRLIEVLGPPPTSGTRDAFVELVMDVACEQLPETHALKDAGRDVKAVCQALREDGAYVEAGENDNLIVQKLGANSNSFGIFGYSFLEENGDKVRGTLIDGHAPTFENIASGMYPVSRPLQFYVKKAHVGTIPGMEAFLKEFTSEKAWGPDGYLSDKGLVPMPDKERARWAASVAKLTRLDTSGL